MNIEGIHHVAIICSDYEKSKHFYTKILGFRVIEETYREERQSYKLDIGLPNGDQVELFSFPDNPERPDSPEARGLRHLAFIVSSVQDAADSLRAHGIDVEAIRLDELTNKHYTFFKDPDGLPLELYEKS